MNKANVDEINAWLVSFNLYLSNVCSNYHNAVCTKMLISQILHTVLTMITLVLGKNRSQ